MPWPSQSDDFLDEAGGVEDDAIADDADFARPKDAGWDEVENVFDAGADDGVAGVVAALRADDDIGFVREEIDDFSFAFVAPLGSDDDGIWHGEGR